ncbi:glycosyltransferase involved in cell wall biosynthesis [Bradyrhizobium algeriense]|uniref:Glycosyltransferase involved in cell wall biosynthesis n=1 Tax=Bradyrhizobium algeriense TaxID=634784 RepID=A0ABU8B679_9BRAD
MRAPAQSNAMSGRRHGRTPLRIRNAVEDIAGRFAHDGSYRPLRLAFLWAYWTGYIDSTVQYIRSEHHVMVFRARQQGHVGTLNGQYRFSEESFGPVEAELTYGAEIDVDALDHALREFEPDGIIVLSWRRRAYRQLMKRWAGRAVRIVCLDSQWRGHLGALRSGSEFPLLLKQWGGRALRRYFFHTLFDGALLSGPKYLDGHGFPPVRQSRQMKFALKMGFRPDDICEGFAVCDWHTLAHGRHPANARERKRFLFVGRYAPVKGVSILVEAYRLYSRHSSEPWPLIVAGDGPLKHLFSGVPGIQDIGFVQTKQLPEVLAEAACLVLPSILEPWGVVIQEAVSAGLGVICTDECGAGDVFVQQDVNGFIVPTGNVDALAGAMRTFSESEDLLERVPNASIEMSKRLLPSSFAETVIPFIQTRRQFVS